MVTRAPHVCPACGSAAEELGPGPDGRPGRSCLTCRGLERHRFLALLLEAVAPRALAGGGVLLDIAPSPTTTPRLRELAPGCYVSVDFAPAADRRVVDVRASLTELPLPDGVVGLMICYHVLEHVPDDAAAMAEIARVLRPGGIALVQVPFRPGPTDEDPAAPSAERLRRFGQADHVRYYGDDFDERLERAGLLVERVRPSEVVTPQLLELFTLPPHDLVWLCHRGGAEPAMTVAQLGTSWGAALAVVIRRMAQRAADDRRAEVSARDDRRRSAEASVRALTEQLATERAETERWRTSYRKLRGRLPVRALFVLARARDRVLRRR